MDKEKQRLFVQKVAELAAKYGPDLNHPTRGEFDGDDDDEDWGEEHASQLVATSSAASGPLVSAERRKAVTQARGVQQELDQLMKATKDRWIANNPSAAKKVRITAGVKVTPRQGGRVSKTYERIIQRILSQEGALSTQTAIAEYVRRMDPSLTPPKDWNKPMPSGWALAKLKALIVQAPIPFNDIRVNSRTTLASLLRAARTRASKEVLGSIEFDARITITPTHVIINGQSWRIASPATAARRIIVTERALLKLAS